MEQVICRQILKNYFNSTPIERFLKEQIREFWINKALKEKDKTLFLTVTSPSWHPGIEEDVQLTCLPKKTDVNREYMTAREVVNVFERANTFTN